MMSNIKKKCLSWELVFLILVLGLHCLIFEDGLGGNDGWGHFANLESIIEDRDLDLGNNMYGWNGNGTKYCEKTERWVTGYPLGMTLLDAPFYLASQIVAKFIKFNPPSFNDGPRTLPYKGLSSGKFLNVLSVIFAHNIYAILAMIILFKILIELNFSRGISLFTTLVCFFASPLLYYATNGFSHATSTFLVTSSFYVFILLQKKIAKGEKNIFLIFILGLCVALSAWTRYVNGLLFFPYLFALILSYRGLKKSAIIKNTAIYTAPLVVVFFLSIYQCHTQFGSWFEAGYGGYGWISILKIPPPVINLLFSVDHGFLLWFPCFTLSFIGLAFLIKNIDKKLSLAGIIALINFLLIAFVYGTRTEYNAGGCYAQRYLTCTIPFLGLGLCAFMDRYKKTGLIKSLIGLSAIYSYCLFLLTKANLVYYNKQCNSYEGQYIWDYLYIFKEHMSAREVINRIWYSSFTLPLMGKYIWIFVSIVILACVLIWRYKNYCKKKFPFEEGFRGM